MAYLYKVEFMFDAEHYDIDEVLQGLTRFSPMVDLTVEEVTPGTIPDSEIWKYIYPAAAAASEA
jgi:hypothetical protein